MANNRIVLNDETTGANSYLKVTKIARLYCEYGANTTPLGLTQNVWTRFVYPSTGYSLYRSHEFAIDPAISRFTYTGTGGKWFSIRAVCNILKTGGNSTSRDIEFQWRLNGNPVGYPRRSHMNLDDAQIISGAGQVYLTSGQYVEPWIRNIENSDDCLLSNCGFDIKEDNDYAFVQ